MKPYVPPLVLVICVLLLCAGCTQAQNPSAGNDTAQKTIRISGAFALYPMMITWSEEYKKIHPEVDFEISAGGAGKGMTDALTGMVDIGMVSRDISPAEEARGARYVAVAKDAVVGTYNARNPAGSAISRRGLTQNELQHLFVNGSITDWSSIGGTPGTAAPVHVYTRSDACGASDVWSKFLGNFTQEDLYGTGVYGDPGIVEAVKGDTAGIGYNNINFAYDMISGRPVAGIAIVPLDLNSNGVIDPDEDFYGTRDDLIRAISEKKYPSPPARMLYLATRDSFSGETREFVRWILTDGQNLTATAGYLPVDPVVVQEELKTLG
ncbi:MAG: substrate-binding domain-containing protein [Methanoregula sp.]|jgi:phosphate transport system substrate-binding protein